MKSKLLEYPNLKRDWKMLHSETFPVLPKFLCDPNGIFPEISEVKLNFFRTGSLEWNLMNWTHLLRRIMIFHGETNTRYK